MDELKDRIAISPNLAWVVRRLVDILDNNLKQTRLTIHLDEDGDMLLFEYQKMFQYPGDMAAKNQFEWAKDLLETIHKHGIKKTTVIVHVDGEGFPGKIEYRHCQKYFKNSYK